MPSRGKPASPGGAIRARRQDPLYPAALDGSTATADFPADSRDFRSLWWLVDDREYESADDWPAWSDYVVVGLVDGARP